MQAAIHPKTGHIVVHRSALPPGVGDLLPASCVAFSVHRGVVVCWDRDFDERVIGLVDAMQECERRELGAIHEAEGCVLFCWPARVPRNFQVDSVLIHGDYWTATHRVGAGEDTIELPFGGTLDLTAETKPAEELDGPTLIIVAVVADDRAGSRAGALPEAEYRSAL